MNASRDILSQISRLPAFPASAAKLGELLHDERAGAPEVEKVIRPDPALTANLLRMAASAYFSPRSRPETVRQAVTLLGVKRTFEIATGAALASLLPAKLPGYEMEARAFWLHCVAVAVFAERLAKEARAQSPDLLFTSGLLHDVGKLVISAFVQRESPTILVRARHGMDFSAAEREVLGVDHAEVGAHVAAAWRLPEPVAWAARWHHRPAEAPQGVDRTLVDLVHAADVLAISLGLGCDAGELARSVDEEAFSRLGLRVRRLEHVAGEGLQAVKELAAALGEVREAK
ncbi:MAG TPA: HDOD domain-containing protein [Anaeromyxobacteraceae bacterium]|nr:HDOD domain-containing protein [Anaeromyxobacteraceae bacterium]